MNTKALTQFKEIREALIGEFNTKKAELAAMETELIALGIIQQTAPVVTPTKELPGIVAVSGKGQEAILKAIGKGSITEKRIKELTGKSGINTTLNKMVANKQLKKDETVRPALYSKA